MNINGGINKFLDSVLSLFHLKKYKEQIMYLFVGGMTTAIDWAVFTLLGLIIPPMDNLWFFEKLPNAIEYTAAWTAAVLFAYWASKHFVFDCDREKSPVQFFKFVASRLLTLIISLAGDMIFCGWLGWNKFIVKLILSVAVVIINYITGKWLVFIKNK